MVDAHKDLEGYIWVSTYTGEVLLTPTEARQVITDIMAALDEPAKVDMTNDVKNERPNISTQAYQEWIVEPDIRKGEPAFEADLTRFTHLYKIMMQRGLVR